MNEILIAFDIIISFLAFVLVAVTLFLYNVVKLEPISHIKSRLFTRFKEVKICIALSLFSVFFLWMAASLEFLTTTDDELSVELLGRLNLVFFELLWLSLYPLGRIFEGNKKRRQAQYRATLKKLKETR